ncbi:MAG: HAD-IIA family hydrolase [Oscillochloridaceae bacterium]|nr:HAD-IIA family hydrolase [Chloroflexaceae bacterium]MDW8390854.1 HAD-IIA family hydrolase [Oscillochloridaceae bacterium]
MLAFTTIKAVLFDMDGVLYRGNQPLAGARELLAFLDEQGLGYACITNNASMTPAQYEAKLARMGLNVPAGRIITSAIATGRALRAMYPRGTRVYIVGMDGLREALLHDGHFVEDARTADLVVQGADFALTYHTLRTATLLIRAGARFVATNPDRTFPSEEGLIPGAGAITAALVAATDTQPLVIGKPAPTMFQVAAETLGAPPTAVLVVGDRLDTDIAGAAAAGMPAALILTGVSSRAEAEASPVRPAAIYADLGALLEEWRAKVADR